jgi:hypothetical protein
VILRSVTHSHLIGTREREREICLLARDQENQSIIDRDASNYCISFPEPVIAFDSKPNSAATTRH